MAKAKDSMLFGFHSTITDEQQDFLDLILEPVSKTQIIIVEAQAGTGKTQIATIGAKLRGTNMRYIFAPVQEGAQGFLPGDIVDKSRPYTAPVEQALIKINEDPQRVMFDPRLNTFMNSTAWVNSHPHTFERGKNYEDETVVIDEAQNFTKDELRKTITRCADSCKIIITGNIKQCDLLDKTLSGFEPYIYHSKGLPWIKKIELNHNFRGRVAQWADSI